MPTWVLIAAVGTLGLYLLFVLALLLLGRRSDARALADFVPDCVVLFSRLLRDHELSRTRCLALVALVAYLAMPFDLVPDFIPVAGQLDDAVVALLVLRFVIAGCSAARLSMHWPGPEASLGLILRLAGKAPRPTASRSRH